MNSINVGLIWQSPYSSNLGLGALAQSCLDILNTEAEKCGRHIDVTFFSAKIDNFNAKNIKTDIKHVFLSKEMVSPKYFASVVKKINSCHVIFDVGEGDSFSDIYGYKRFLKMAISKFIYHRRNGIQVCSPQTIGPFLHPFSKLIARLAVKNVAAIFARDELSYDRATKIAPGRPVHLTTDMAFALHASKNKPSYFPIIDENITNIGINVSGLLYRGGYTKKNQFKLWCDYVDLIDKTIIELRNETGGQCKIWLIPHVHSAINSSIESDRVVSEECQKIHEFLDIAPPFTSSSDAKLFIGKMDFFCGARMHATIAALSSGVACVPMSYSPKFEGLYHSIGYNHVLPMTHMGTDECVNFILDRYRKRVEMRKDVLSSYAQANKKLDIFREYVGSILKEI